MEPVRISGRDLGAVALAEFCPRCFWVQRRAPQGLPFQIFPGIFSSIDAYSKRVVHAWFDRHGGPPAWLADLDGVVGYTLPPHHSRFCTLEPTTNVLLTGAPDALFRLADGSLLIADYKTAKFTGTQDRLFPLYRTQLNAYALIAEATGLGRVSRLALIYTEPVTDAATAATDGVHRADGFTMGFSSRVLPVALDLASIPPLLDRARALVERDRAPAGRVGCKDCGKLDGLLELLAPAAAA